MQMVKKNLPYIYKSLKNLPKKLKGVLFMVPLVLLVRSTIDSVVHTHNLYLLEVLAVALTEERNKKSLQITQW